MHTLPTSDHDLKNLSVQVIDTSPSLQELEQLTREILDYNNNCINYSYNEAQAQANG